MQNNKDIWCDESIKNGDLPSFKIFFKKNYSNLLSFVITLTHDRDQAEDIVQLAFIQIWKKRAQLPTNLTLKQILFITAKNLFIDQYRSNRSRTHLYAELTTESLEQEIENDDYVQEQIKKLHKIIQELPPKCQQILTMTKLKGFTQQEVADYLNISVRTVEAQIRLAYKKIREEFENEKKSVILFLLHEALQKNN
ncbi:RNA polymerase sigma factor [Zhouia sp. PK063]|uniref:RNA polymerase sigma factor n=1 Tax=Zhouia sp. PK063 TaxID=3373602 RepID=UPI0037933BB6